MTEGDPDWEEVSAPGCQSACLGDVEGCSRKVCVAAAQVCSHGFALLIAYPVGDYPTPHIRTHSPMLIGEGPAPHACARRRSKSRWLSHGAYRSRDATLHNGAYLR